MVLRQLYYKHGAKRLAPTPLPVALETLENRILFSGTPVAYLDNLGVLTVEGTSAKDVIVVNVDHNTARVSLGNRRAVSVFSNITGLAILGNDGNDDIAVNVKNVSNSDLGGEKGHSVFFTQVDGGSGKDTITVKVSSQENGSLSVSGGDDRDVITLISTSVESFVHGGEGDDVITCLSGYVPLEGRVHYDGIVLLGADGNDRITSFVDAFLSGGQGDDRLIAIGGKDGSVFYGGEGVNRAFGGKGNDTMYSFGTTTSDHFLGGAGNDGVVVLFPVKDLFFNGGLGQDFVEYRQVPDPSHTLISVEKISGLGSLGLDSDSENPAIAVALAGSVQVVANVFSIQAQEEDIWLERVSLQLSEGRPSDLNEVTIWDGDVLVGRGVFVNGSTTSTIYFQNRILLTKDVAKRLTVKVDLQQVGVNEAGTEGVVVKVDVVGALGSGKYSGAQIYSSSTSVASGIKMYKAFPAFSPDSLPVIGVADGRLMRFKVTVVGGSVGLARLSFNLGIVGAEVEAVSVYAFTDPVYSMPVPGFSSGILHSNYLVIDEKGNVQLNVEDQAGQPKALQIPSGATVYFEVRANVTPTSSFASITTTLVGDNSPLMFNVGYVGTFADVDLQAFKKLIWSPNTRKVSTSTDPDWTNGFLLPGLPYFGLTFLRSL